MEKVRKKQEEEEESKNGPIKEEGRKMRKIHKGKHKIIWKTKIQSTASKRRGRESSKIGQKRTATTRSTK